MSILLPHPEKGSLGKYSTSGAERTRRVELNKSVRERGYKTTVLDLNLRATLNKNQAPDASKIMREDIDYLRQKYRGGTAERKSRKSRKHKSRKSARPVSGSKSRKSRKSRQRRSKRSARPVSGNKSRRNVNSKK